jgi:hypothetical protein
MPRPDPARAAARTPSEKLAAALRLRRTVTRAVGLLREAGLIVAGRGRAAPAPA